MYYADKRWFNQKENFIDGRPLSLKDRLFFTYFEKRQQFRSRMYTPGPYPDTIRFDTAICGIFKDEGPYLREWVEYHLQSGIGHIYMYNNNSSDNYEEILKPYIDRGYVELIDWPHDHAQLEAYEDCITKFSGLCKWIGFIDLDEFVVPEKGKTIYDLLRKFEDHHPSVVLNWKMFGSSGIIDRDLSIPVTESFRSCSPVMHANGKCFFNTRYKLDSKTRRDGSFHHRTYGIADGNRIYPVNCFGRISKRSVNVSDSAVFPACIHHYCIKSLGEYEAKMRKTDVFFEKNPHNMDYFHYYDDACTAYDDSIHFSFSDDLFDREDSK